MSAGGVVATAVWLIVAAVCIMAWPALSNAPEPTEAHCRGEVLHPGGTCVSTGRSGGVRQSYQDVLRDERATHAAPRA